MPNVTDATTLDLKPTLAPSPALLARAEGLQNDFAELVTDTSGLDENPALQVENPAPKAEKPYVRKGSPRPALTPEAARTGLQNREKLLQLASLLMKVLGFIRNKGGEAGSNFLEKLMNDPKMVNKKAKDPAAPKPALDDATNTFNETVLRHLHEHPELLKRALLDMRVAADDVSVSASADATASAVAPVALTAAAAVVKPVMCGQYDSRVAANNGKGFTAVRNRPEPEVMEGIAQDRKRARPE